MSNVDASFNKTKATQIYPMVSPCALNINATTAGTAVELWPKGRVMVDYEIKDANEISLSGNGLCLGSLCRCCSRSNRKP